jgi:hypothetical protein
MCMLRRDRELCVLPVILLDGQRAGPCVFRSSFGIAFRCEYEK